MDNNKKTIETLYRIGKLPSAEIVDKTDFPLKDFDELLQKIKLPIDFETALKLINLSPPINTGCYGVEWSLLHLVETYYKDTDDEEYKKLLDEAEDGEVKKLLRIRFENHLKNRET
jgi:hypothetical protein